MRRTVPSLQLFAVLTTDMSYLSPHYRGGRRPFGRSFSDRSFRDSNIRSVRDANSAHHEAQREPSGQNYSQNQRFFRRGPPPFDHYQNRAFRPSQQFRPRPQKPLDYRDWEYPKSVPPRDSEKFIILSYNILADYLAINHRSKLYFHIPRHILDWEWRKRNIIFELGLWSADIMCFQEVDRYEELEEELKIRGYNGIWKMRTGNAIDGCAIFWRTSRFKLLYEESIEYSKLGLRDNVAQICVLELLMRGNNTANTSGLLTSSTGSNKVVVCNIHVLYNPRRGEIKLAQVRTLLDRAYEVSKVWDDTPVVLCGDFNCTPKSPLYSFISDQKLDLSGIDRDKVSGQASAEIRAPRPYNSGRYPEGHGPIPRSQCSENSIQAPVMVDNKLGNSIFDKQKQNKCGSGDTTETQCNSGIGSSVLVPADSSREHSTIFQREGEFPISEMNDGIHKSTHVLTSHPEDGLSSTSEMGQGKELKPASVSDQGLSCENSNSSIYEETLSKNFDNLELLSKLSPSECSGSVSPQPVVSNESIGISTPTLASITFTSTNINNIREKHLEDIPPQELKNFCLDDQTVHEDQSTFLSASPGLNDSLRHNFDCPSRESSPDPNDSQLLSSSNEVQHHFSPDLDSDAVDVEQTAYDPSSWTPMEIATATGNADCFFLEHPLKLKSAYAEVEDRSGTRDPNGEPLVTSYNRCFLGTVDYIWSSEGLQTVRALAPIPKHAMQWTAGFPTKKWGSDHIALASELAFTKEATTNNVEVQ